MSLVFPFRFLMIHFTDVFSHVYLVTVLIFIHIYTKYVNAVPTH